MLVLFEDILTNPQLPTFVALAVVALVALIQVLKRTLLAGVNPEHLTIVLNIAVALLYGVAQAWGVELSQPGDWLPAVPSLAAQSAGVGLVTLAAGEYTYRKIKGYAPGFKS